MTNKKRNIEGHWDDVAQQGHRMKQNRANISKTEWFLIYFNELLNWCGYDKK